jgi:hypothetical protein
MKFLYALLAGALSATLSLAATAADWSVDVVALPGGVAGLLDDQGRTVARTRSGVFFHLTLDEDVKFRASRLASYTPPQRPLDGRVCCPMGSLPSDRGRSRRRISLVPPVAIGMALWVMPLKPRGFGSSREGARP